MTEVKGVAGREHVSQVQAIFLISVLLLKMFFFYASKYTHKKKFTLMLVLKSKNKKDEHIASVKCFHCFQ